jgi:hypothetical protein
MFEYRRPLHEIDSSRLTAEVVERLVLEDQFLEEFIVSQSTILVGLGEDHMSEEELALKAASPDTLPPEEFRGGNGHDELNRCFENPRYLPYVNRMFETATSQIGRAPVSFSDEKRERVAQILGNNLSIAPTPIPVELDEAFLTTTHVERGFVSEVNRIEAMASDNKPLAHTLFGIPKFEYEATYEVIEGAEKYITESIKDKRILLFGGGNSCGDLIYNNKDFKPQVIINVDPYRIRTEEQTETPNPYIRIDTTAEDPNLEDKLESVGFPQVDEIWASYSVPYYSNKPEDIRGMFENAKKLLAPGGMLRIYPFSIPERVVNIFDMSQRSRVQEVFDLNERLRDTYFEVLDEINSDKNFNVSLVRVGNDDRVLLIQKVQ